MPPSFIWQRYITGKTSVGINGMKQDNKNKGAEQLIPDYSLLDIGGYLFTQKTFKEFTFSGGFRYDTRNVEINDLMDGAAVKSNGFSRLFLNFSVVSEWQLS